MKDLSVYLAVTGRVTGCGIGSVIAHVKADLAKPNARSPGVAHTLGGLYQQQQIAFAGLVRVLFAALPAEVMLLLFLH